MLLDDLGLGPALRFLGEGVERRSGIAVVVEDSGCGRGAPRIETAVYRAVQEGLTNVVRHSRATRAVVRLSASEGELVCELRDDGCGFDCARRRTPGTPGGIGLQGIRERVAPLGGELEVASRPGAGTTVTIRVPWEVSHAPASADCR
jgi:two-component system sensor histidine kinase UhpB